MQKKYEKKEVHGILLVDKPIGITSFDVIRKCRRLFRTKRIGHCGTLDPFASGLLVLLFGDYTRLSNYIMDEDKRYVAKISFTGQTDTDDCEGQIIKEATAETPILKKIEQILPDFVGIINQVPPIYSAIKKDGKKMYQLARVGEKVDIPARQIRIESIEILEHQKDAVIVDIKCQKGTYIRALGRDIGQRLNAPAHVSELRRLQSGSYFVENAYTVEQLEQLAEEKKISESIISGKKSILGVVHYDLNDVEISRCRQGKKLKIHKILPEEVKAAIEDDAALLGFDGEQPIAILRVQDNQLKVARGFPEPK